MLTAVNVDSCKGPAAHGPEPSSQPDQRPGFTLCSVSHIGGHFTGQHAGLDTARYQAQLERQMQPKHKPPVWCKLIPGKRRLERWCITWQGGCLFVCSECTAYSMHVLRQAGTPTEIVQQNVKTWGLSILYQIDCL